MKILKLSHPKVLAITAAIITMVILAAFFFLTTVNKKETPHNSSNSSQTQIEPTGEALEQKAIATTTPVSNTAQMAPETPTQPTEDPKSIDILTREYAKDQGETDYQAGCFYQIIGYRTGWNISEDGMHTKFASIKAVYPSICAAWNVVRTHPADAPLRGL
jgi:hypothetical protein